MPKFEGFDAEAFDFLSRRRRDTGDVEWIRRLLERFGEKLLNKGLQSLDSSFYRNAHVGMFHPEEDDHFWVAFGPQDFDRLSQSAHQSVGLYAGWLDVFLCVELIAAINLLRKRLRESTAGYLDLVAAVPEPFQVELRERTRVSPTRFFVGPPVVSISPAEARNAASDGFAELMRQLTRIEYPHFSIRRRFDKQRVLELRGGVVDEVIVTMKAFQPLVGFINGD